MRSSRADRAIFLARTCRTAEAEAQLTSTGSRVRLLLPPPYHRRDVPGEPRSFCTSCELQQSCYERGVCCCQQEARSRRRHWGTSSGCRGRCRHRLRIQRCCKQCCRRLRSGGSACPLWQPCTWPRPSADGLQDCSHCSSRSGSLASQDLTSVMSPRMF